MDLTFSLVIARFRESVEDVKDLIGIFHKLNPKVYIYNKDNISSVNKEDLGFEDLEITIENLPNLGREGHTSLYHLHKYYNTVTDVLYFIPASYKNKTHPETCAPGCIFKTLDDFHLLNTEGLRNRDLSPILTSYQDNLELWYSWVLDSWGGTHSENSKVAVECNYVKCRNRPFGKWIAENVINPLHLTQFSNPLKNGLCGFIQTLKERVHNIPRDLIQTWIQEFEEDGPNSEVGHYWERTWGTVLGSFNSSIPVKNINTLVLNKNISINSVNFPELSFNNFDTYYFKINKGLDVFQLTEPLNSKEKCVSIKFKGLNEKYLCSDKTNYLILKNFEDTEEFKNSASFRVYQGLNLSGFSFESYDKPNHFIRHTGYVLYTHPFFNSDLYKLDSSFEIIEVL